MGAVSIIGYNFYKNIKAPINKTAFEAIPQNSALIIKENNFKGDGVKLKFNLAVNTSSIKGQFDYTNPNFRYSDRAVTTSIQSTTTDKEKDHGFKSSLNRFALGSSFEQFDRLYFSPSFSIANEQLTTTANASEKAPPDSTISSSFNIFLIKFFIIYFQLSIHPTLQSYP